MFSLLIILALLIRVILMPISVHSDLFFINIFPALMKEKNVYDIYYYFSKNLPNAPYLYYPPLTYFTFGAFQHVYSYFSSTFSNWMMVLYNLEISGFQGQAVDFIKAALNPHLFKDLFLAKLPYLVIDILAVFSFIKFVKNRVQARTLTLLWLFNPVHIYSTYLMGQYDIIPSLFVLLGFLIFKNNLYLGIFTLGIAAAYKNYAFLFILIIILVYAKTWAFRLKLALISSIPYLISLLPTLIHNPFWAVYSFLPKIYLNRSVPLVGWPLYSQYLKYVVLTFTLFAIFALASSIKIKDKYRLVIGLSLSAVLLVYAFYPKMSFHYLVWEMPLVLLWFKKFKICAIVLIVQAFSLASYKLLANHLQMGLFAPLNPDYFSALPTFNSQVNQIFSYTIISNTGFFIFFFINVYLASKIMLDLFFKEQTN